nr:ionotropic receptor 2 [Psyttalia incisi]
MSRYHYALVLQLRDFFNFTINLQIHESWGYLINGTFGGLIGALMKGETDASVSSYQYKPERMDVVDYLVETLDVNLRFFFRHPRSNDLQNNFLKPFTIHLWWVIIAVSLSYWVFMVFLKKFEIYYEKIEVNENTISSTALTAIAAITQQGLSTAPMITSGRVVFFSLFLWTLLLFQFYSASIVGSLLAPPPRWITTLDNLTDSNLECVIEDMPYMVDYFATTANPHSQKLFERKIKPTKKKPKGSYMSASEGIERVREGGFAFHINVATGYKMIEDTFKENEICELQQIDMVGQCLTSMVTRKHSPFNEMFTWSVRKAVESGLIKRIDRVWNHQCPQCPESYSSKPTPVSMQQFSPAIFLLLIGSGLSFLILGIENLHYWRYSDHLSNVVNTNSVVSTDDIEEQSHPVDDFLTDDGQA